jgi:copper chaperone CopZ
MRLPLFLFFLAGAPMRAAEEPAAAQAVLVVSGLECGSCVYVAQYAISQTKGVADVEVVQTFDDFALVTYNPRELSEHQIVQSLREAPGLHGMPYVATMRLRIPGYNTDGNAAKVKALALRWKKWIELVDFDERENEVQIQFHELEKDSKGVLPTGWTLSEFQLALRKELGMSCEVVGPAE